MTTTRARCPGFSLLEMMIAITILTTIMLFVAMLMHTTSDVVSVESTRNQMERSGQRALEIMAAELRDSAARVVAIAADGSSIQFQIPVDRNGNGTVLDGAGALEFGFLQNGVPMAGTITYRFILSNRAGMPDVVSEPALRMRLNDDADTTDTFVRGYLVRQTQMVGGPLLTVYPALTDPSIVQPNGNWGGDIDGDGVADPIFRLDAPGNERVIVNLWALQVGNRKYRHFVNSTTSVWFRNR